MSCPHCFGCSPFCSNRHAGRLVRAPIKKCPVCRRANPPENPICKRCGSDLSAMTVKQLNGQED